MQGPSYSLTQESPQSVGPNKNIPAAFNTCAAARISGHPILSLLLLPPTFCLVVHSIVVKLSIVVAASLLTRRKSTAAHSLLSH
jgi:hypothetical protein